MPPSLNTNDYLQNYNEMLARTAFEALSNNAILHGEQSAIHYQDMQVNDLLAGGESASSDMEPQQQTALVATLVLPHARLTVDKTKRKPPKKNEKKVSSEQNSHEFQPNQGTLSSSASQKRSAQTLDDDAGSSSSEPLAKRRVPPHSSQARQTTGLLTPSSGDGLESFQTVDTTQQESVVKQASSSKVTALPVYGGIIRIHTTKQEEQRAGRVNHIDASWSLYWKVPFQIGYPRSKARSPPPSRVSAPQQEFPSTSQQDPNNPNYGPRNDQNSSLVPDSHYEHDNADRAFLDFVNTTRPSSRTEKSNERVPLGQQKLNRMMAFYERKVSPGGYMSFDAFEGSPFGFGKGYRYQEVLGPIWRKEGRGRCGRGKNS